MIFLDTSYYKGLLDKKDIHHKDSLKISEYLNESTNEITVINTTVLVETLNWIAGTRDVVRNIFDSILEDNKMIYLTPEDYLKSLEINGWYDNSINYSDCTILNTMMNLGIRKIVSFDSDFKKLKKYNVISSL